MSKRTAQEVVRRALAEVGTVEKPANSNKTKYGVAYGWNGVAWCAIFIWWLIDFGATAVLKKTASTLVLWEWAKSEGILRDPDYMAKAGDLVLFQMPGPNRINHVELVVKDRTSSTAALVCVGGNTGGTDPRMGGMVAATKRKAYIKGIVDMSGVYASPKKSAATKKSEKSSKPAYALTRLLERGTTGKDVAELQRALRIDDDGIFGPVTEGAVETYQSSKKLKTDGVVGERTAKALGWAWEPNRGFSVRVTGSSVIVRSGAGTNFKDTGRRVKRGQVHRISAEVQGRGANRWFRLANGSGWFSGDFAKRV